MKKCWLIFWITSGAWLAFILLGSAVLARVSAILCAIFAVIGALWLIYRFLRFRSIEYKLENGVLIILGGVFVKYEKRVRLDDILWINEFSIAARSLFTVAHTAGGALVVFGNAAALRAGRER